MRLLRSKTLLIALLAAGNCLVTGVVLPGSVFAQAKKKKSAAEKLDIPPPPPASGDQPDGFEDDEDGAEEPLREFGAPVQELPPNTRVEDITEPSADYHYAGFGRPDPFQPPVSIQAVVPDAVEIPIVSPLQRYPLKDLKLVGVWMRSRGDRKALVMTPSNEGIIVKPGDPVGSGGGKVLSIGESWMLVREFLIAEDGTRQFSDSRIIFDAKNEAGTGASARGSIVITPGATQPQLVLPAGASGTTTATGTVTPPNQVPANQAPANQIPANQSAVDGNKGAPAAGNAQSPQSASQAPGLPATPVQPAPAATQGKTMFNF